MRKIRGRCFSSKRAFKNGESWRLMAEDLASARVASITPLTNVGSAVAQEADGDRKPFVVTKLNPTGAATDNLESADMHHMPLRLPRNVLFCVFAIVLSLASRNISPADVLVHETFSDDSITDGAPAVWEGTCFMDECGPNPPTADLVIEDGHADLTIRDFAMWRLKSVDGKEVQPGNQWSMRARITPQKGTNNKFVGQGSTVGVGLDEYYWAAGWSTKNDTQSKLGAGRFSDSVDSIETLPCFEPWVIQLDVHPDRTEAFRWPVGDPSQVASVRWSADGDAPTISSVPVFWGSWGGNSIIEEVIVATTAMGVGGDFDLSGITDVADLNALAHEIREHSNDPRYNLTADEIVDQADMNAWLETIKQTTYGDADLDGTVAFADFLVLSQNFGQVGDWSNGDFDGENEVQFSDFLMLSGNIGHASIDVASVPEPTTASPLIMAAMAVLSVLRGYGRTRRQG